MTSTSHAHHHKHVMQHSEHAEHLEENTERLEHLKRTYNEHIGKTDTQIKGGIVTAAFEGGWLAFLRANAPLISQGGSISCGAPPDAVAEVLHCERPEKSKHVILAGAGYEVMSGKVPEGIIPSIKAAITQLDAEHAIATEKVEQEQKIMEEVSSSSSHGTP